MTDAEVQLGALRLRVVVKPWLSPGLFALVSGPQIVIWPGLHRITRTRDGVIVTLGDTGAEPGAEPEFDLSTRAGKVAWCKHRAAQSPWNYSVSSMSQDMTLMGIPLAADVIIFGTLMMIAAGEAGARDWLDSIS